MFLQYAQSDAAHWTQKYDQKVHEEHPNAYVMNFNLFVMNEPRKNVVSKMWILVSIFGLHH